MTLRLGLVKEEGFEIQRKNRNDAQGLSSVNFSIQMRVRSLTLSGERESEIWEFFFFLLSHFFGDGVHSGWRHNIHTHTPSDMGFARVGI